MVFDSIQSFAGQLRERPFVLLIGNPVHHSFSPAIHNFAFEQAGLDWKYYAVSVQEQDFPHIKKLFLDTGFRGANITVPYKVKVLSVIDDLDPRAANIGAVNTVVTKNGRVHGYNSDNAGFLDGLKSAGINDIKKAAILGSGGTSRMVVNALRGLGCSDIRVFSRNPGQNETGYAYLGKELEHTDLLVNCTPVGMWPAVNDSPVDANTLRRMKNGAVYDLIYRPFKTKLLLEAENLGLRIIPGLEMFVGQAARSFERWTGRLFPRVEVKNMLHKMLQKDA